MQTSESSTMPAADAAPAFYTAVARNGCALAQYSASTEEGVIFNVLSVARNEGFKGSGLDRLIELGWVVRPVYTQPSAPQAVQPAVPEGWKLVPTEPQDMQQLAGAQAIRFDTTVINKMWTANKVYREMIAAAPVHPADGVPVQSAYALEDDGFAGYLDGQVSRFSVRRADGSHLAWVVAERHVDDGEAIAREIVAALNTTHATQQGLDALDAARYRWLRERDLETVHKGGVFAGMTPENYVINGVDLDAAIDAAIAAQANQGGV